MPGASAGKQGDGVAADTTKVPDASRISPPITAQGTRAGHDISLTVNIDAGMEVKQVECKSHPVVENRPGDGRVTVALKNQETIPNKDFILRYRTATDQIADALLTHKDERGSFFTLILQPPQKVQRKDAVGRELIFVLDTSGSMQGFPVTQAKFVMSKAIDNLGPQDTFNLITFSGDTSILWDAPRPNTPQNREEAQSFLASRQGRGGTEMMKAVDAALVQTRNVKPQAAGEPIRVVCFMTDGYVGNDMEIIDAVKKNAGTTRVFSFGIGNSVNRFLLDGMARAGRGEVEYVTLESKAQEAAERFYQRIDAPVLTDVAISWGAMGVADVYPAHIPDLFSNKPIIVHGRFTGRNKDGPPPTLRGNTANGKFERPIRWAPVEADGAARDALASLWARAKVSDLMFRDLAAMQSGNFPEDLKKQITAVGTEFRLMTQFTSFVAVEELTITKGGQATKIAVPVEMPDGVSYEGIFGEKKQGEQLVLRGRALSTAGGLSGAYGGAVAGRRYANANNTQLYAIAPGQAAAQPQPAPLALPAAAAAPADGTVATRGAQPLTKAAPASRSDRQVRESERAEAVSELSDSEAVANGPAQPAPDASTKLAEPLRGLAEKVQKQGKDGTLTAGGVAVTGYKVDVMVYLSDASPKTLEALKKLGFEQSAESKAVRLVIGSIDVRKLFDLAKLDAVVSVRPVGA
jgi:Ca-activated chloride channel family protein